MRQKLLFGICLLAITFFATSCKKNTTNEPNSDYYVKVNKNGTWISYPTTAGELGPDLANPNLTDLGVTGQSSSGNEIFNLTIQVNGTNFSTGTYHSDSTKYQTVMSMLVQNGSNAANYEISDAPGKPHSKYIINITEITSTALTGTFTGNYLYDSFGDSTSIMNVTQGEFHVKRVR